MCRRSTSTAFGDQAIFDFCDPAVPGHDDTLRYLVDSSGIDHPLSMMQAARARHAPHDKTRPGGFTRTGVTELAVSTRRRYSDVAAWPSRQRGESRRSILLEALLVDGGLVGDLSEDKRQGDHLGDLGAISRSTSPVSWESPRHTKRAELSTLPRFSVGVEDTLWRQVTPEQHVA